MPHAYDVLGNMKRRLLHEVERIKTIRQECEQLEDAYNRYVDLRNEWVRREKRMKRITGVIEESCPEITTSPKELRDEVSLWEAMKEYLHYVPEARIGEMELFFEGVLLMESANRQAIESALKRHPETFRIRKNKREKFISLKDSGRDD